MTCDQLIGTTCIQKTSLLLSNLPAAPSSSQATRLPRRGGTSPARDACRWSQVDAPWPLSPTWMAVEAYLVCNIQSKQPCTQPDSYLFAVSQFLLWLWVPTCMTCDWGVEHLGRRVEMSCPFGLRLVASKATLERWGPKAGVHGSTVHWSADGEIKITAHHQAGVAGEMSHLIGMLPYIYADCVSISVVEPTPGPVVALVASRNYK